MIAKYFCIICSLFSGYSLSAQNKTSGFSMQLPEIPTIISSDIARQKYLISHFWDDCNFENNIINHKNDFERYFQQYVLLLSSYSKRIDFSSIVNVALSRLKNADTTTILYFTSLYEKYFYNPISNYRDDDIYIPVLRFLITSPKFTELEKTRWKYRLTLAYKNRIGTSVTLFDYQLPNGITQSLSTIKSPYIILYFYNPGCQQCLTVQQMIQRSEILKTAIQNNKLTILAIYTDKDYQAWLNHIKPLKGWIYGYDKQHKIQSHTLYDLKAIPTLYLLDDTKKVLLKDTDVQKIEAYMNK